MPVSKEEYDRVCGLLQRDVEATLGMRHAACVSRTAARVLEWMDEPGRYTDQVVEDVQQEFHDTFIDVAWPPCPHHPNHPLWYHDGEWWCEQNAVMVAKLGELGPRH